MRNTHAHAQARATTRPPSPFSQGSLSKRAHHPTPAPVSGKPFEECPGVLLRMGLRGFREQTGPLGHGGAVLAPGVRKVHHWSLMVAKRAAQSPWAGPRRCALFTPKHIDRIRAGRTVQHAHSRAAEHMSALRPGVLARRLPCPTSERTVLM
eukprot:5998107-Alexandrium_andersonii.AAC.1